MITETGGGHGGDNGDQHLQKRLVQSYADGSVPQGSEFQKVLRNSQYSHFRL